MPRIVIDMEERRRIDRRIKKGFVEFLEVVAIRFREGRIGATMRFAGLYTNLVVIWTLEWRRNLRGGRAGGGADMWRTGGGIGVTSG